jgi:hypothetical protein
VREREREREREKEKERERETLVRKRHIGQRMKGGERKVHGY